MLGVHDRAPRAPELPLRIMRASGEALRAGIEEHDIEGVPVKIYSLEKTIADCFKYRKKIGLDGALEALHESWRERRIAMGQLWHYAGVCGVRTVMRPYLEAVVV
jgi:predicted transcriptional regulator of viral defense system